MSPLPRTTIGLAAIGDDLATCIVRRTAGGGAERRDGPIIRRFLSLNPDDTARQLGELSPAGARVVLALPASACALRPIALTTRTWAKARAEMQRAVPSLFPLSADDALLALMDGAPIDGAVVPSSGWLFAVSRQRAEQWRMPIERALGRPVDEVLPFHVAIAALGLQHDEQATVIEPLRNGGARAHRFRYAHPTQLAQPTDAENPDPNDWASGRFLTLSDTTSSAPVASADTVNALDLAAAAACARMLASEGALASYAPFQGTHASPRSRLVAPLAGLGAAAAVVALGVILTNARYARATQAIAAQQEAAAADVTLARQQRDRHDHLAALLKTYAQLAPASHPRMLPLLASAQQAVPADGFLYRIDLDRQNVAIRGEAPRTLDVLARLEATEYFKSAESLEPPGVIKDRALESFHIRARRAPAEARP